MINVDGDHSGNEWLEIFFAQEPDRATMMEAVNVTLTMLKLCANNFLGIRFYPYNVLVPVAFPINGKYPTENGDGIRHYYTTDKILFVADGEKRT